jgi:hypothetical protein
MKKFMVLMIVVFAAVIGLTMSFQPHTSIAENSASYTIGVPFKKTKKALSKKSSLEDILRIQGIELAHQKMDGINISLGNSEGRFLKRLRENGVTVDGNGEFGVVVHPPYEGRLDLRLLQQFHMDKNGIRSSARLAAPAGSIQYIENNTEIIPEGDDTRVNVTAKLTYSRKIPFFLKDYMDRKVKEGVDMMLSNHQRGLTTYVRQQQ